ncbi:MAG: FAD-dependent monooxygenase [Gammaproteobacteria bacterium]|jgi:ubiquinone biosynthesis UbiH/UbiF/VisC/COQ6 family hydroxylase|nr:FAD-dependent monooxygenase [Gammaproteobacteria bacterium]
MSPEDGADVLVVGDGPVAASAALIALRGHRRVLWLGGEEQASSHSDDPRLFALAPSSIELLRRLGVWAEIPPDEVQLYEEMHVFWAEGGRLHFLPPTRRGMILGAMVPAVSLRRGLERTLAAAGALLRRPRAVLVAHEVHAGRITLRAEDGRVFRARVVLDCEGRGGTLADLVASPRRLYEPRERAIVGVVRASLPHDGIARQVFAREGPLGLLPRADGALGYVWSVSEPLARSLLARGPEGLAQRLSEASAGLLGRLTPEGPPSSFPLLIQRRLRLVAPRLVLLGDAARTVHPFAGQGLNLGFRDLLAFEPLLKNAADPGAWALLRRYERRRAPEDALAVAGLETLRRLLTRPDPWGMRARALDLLDRAEFLKGVFVRLAIGPETSLPP